MSIPVFAALAWMLLTAIAAGSPVTAAPAPAPTPAATPAAKSAPAPVVTATNSKGPFAALGDTDPAVRAVREEVDHLRQVAAQAEAGAPDEAARVRARLDLLTQLLQVLIRQQEQIYLQNQMMLSLLGSGKAYVAGGTTMPTPAGAAQALPRPTGSVSAGPFFGKRGGGKLHRTGCAFGERIHVNTRITFATVTQAITAGFQPCKVCHPEK